jgi:hypothetical protein
MGKSAHSKHVQGNVIDCNFMSLNCLNYFNLKVTTSSTYAYMDLIQLELDVEI